jgi:hypothetical protein
MPSANIKFIAQSGRTDKKKDDSKRMTQDTAGKDPVKDGCVRTGSKEPVIRDTAGDVKDAKEPKKEKEKEKENK